MFKFAFILGLLVVLSNADRDKQWKEFKSNHKKDYKDQNEENRRRSIWENNQDLIKKHNENYEKGLETYTLGNNENSDLLPEEFAEKMTGYKAQESEPEGNSVVKRSLFNLRHSRATIPTSIDYRTLGYVMPVENQGQCGSCWAFSALGALEGQWFKKYGSVVPLSKQNLVDCSSRYGNQGCNGGLMSYAYNYIKANGGVDTQVSYPYTAVAGKCKFNRATIGAKVTGFTRIPSGNEAALKTAVGTVGPIAVAIDGGKSTFQLYKSGVYSDTTCYSVLNHAVLIVGYDSIPATATEPEKPYWIVKNSWGTSWGDKGYINITMNQNICGIALDALYPNVA